MRKNQTSGNEDKRFAGVSFSPLFTPHWPSGCPFKSRHMCGTVGKQQALLCVSFVFHVQPINFHLFGTTAPSGPGPPHSRGF